MSQTFANIRFVALGCGATFAGLIAALSLANSPQNQPKSPSIGGMPVPRSAAPAARPGASTQPIWLLNNPAPAVIDEKRANPVAVADKFASRAKAVEERAKLRAYDGAPPVIPHTIADINVQTCRACHAMGLKAGDKVARMASHPYLVNCTQCHVEAQAAHLEIEPVPANLFVGRQPSGYGGTRAWTGAPPVMPHAVFMRSNCIACHGEYGYDGWRPDHLSRTNCMQCHAPSAEFEQLAPTFGSPDRPDGAFPPANSAE